ncbi:MAG: hypothetical protein WB760_03080 [Xanthobacteraceae bacterium]|jgi:hypothetical protein
MSWLSEAVHHHPETLSAVAACAAVAVTLTGVTFQFFIGRTQARAALTAAQAALENAKNGQTSAQAALINAKNAGRYKIAESRQAWINKVIDTIAELNSIAMAMDANVKLSNEQNLALGASRTRLEILLNPDEADTNLLLAAIDAMYDDVDRKKIDAVVTIARRLLKREWVRIKDELSHIPS